MGWKGPRSNPQVHSANPYQTLSRWMSWTISCKRNCLLRTLHIYQIFSLSSDLCHNQQPTSKAEFSYDAGLLENLFFFFHFIAFIAMLSSLWSWSRRRRRHYKNVFLYSSKSYRFVVMPSLSSLPRHFRSDHRLSLCSRRFPLLSIVFSVFICRRHVRYALVVFVTMKSFISSLWSRR